MEKDLLSLLGTLVVIVAVLALAYVFTRYVAGHTVSGGPAKGGEHLSVIAQLPLGREQKLVLVWLGERCLLLGVTQSSIVCLRELSAEEAAELQQKAAEPAAPSFHNALRSVLEQRKR